MSVDAKEISSSVESELTIIFMELNSYVVVAITLIMTDGKKDLASISTDLKFCE